MKLSKRFTQIVAVLFCVLIVVSFSSCNRVEYFETTGWYCTHDEFQLYCDLYKAKIEELKSIYGIECDDKEEKRLYIDSDVSVYEINMFNDEFTIIIRFNNGEELAFYKIDLYYYGDSAASRENFENQRSLVNFINDFTNYVAFDTKTDKNYFEVLYNECKKSDGKPTVNYSYQYDSSASNNYHYDSVVGNIGYSVTLNYNAYGEYYKMQGDSNCMAFCNHYRFDGLLKPIDIS